MRKLYITLYYVDALGGIANFECCDSVTSRWFIGMSFLIWNNRNKLREFIKVQKSYYSKHHKSSAPLGQFLIKLT